MTTMCKAVTLGTEEHKLNNISAFNTVSDFGGKTNTEKKLTEENEGSMLEDSNKIGWL